MFTISKSYNLVVSQLRGPLFLVDKSIGQLSEHGLWGKAEPLAALSLRVKFALNLTCIKKTFLLNPGYALVLYFFFLFLFEGLLKIMALTIFSFEEGNEDHKECQSCQDAHYNGYSSADVIPRILYTPKQNRKQRYLN